MSYFSFKECRDSGVPDPQIPGIYNCLQWVAYAQTQGQNIKDWCSNSQNFQKCCMTCQSMYNKLIINPPLFTI